MFALLIVPILVAGFMACHIHPVFSYKLHRYEGQYLYLKSAETGLKCFAIAFVICLAAHWLMPDNWSLPSGLASVLQHAGISDRDEALRTSWFLVLSTLTCLSPWVLKCSVLLRLRMRSGVWNPHLFILQELLDDSPLDDLLFRLSVENKDVMLMMDDRKVYVGKIISMGEPSETLGMDQDISIMPLMSGYRDKDTLRVNFTTDYEQVDAEIYLSLRQEAIVSATEFNFKAYRTWQQSRRKPRRKPSPGLQPRSLRRPSDTR